MKYDFASKRRRASILARQAHAGQTRTKGTMPTWHHVDRVSRLLELQLETYREGTPEQRQTTVIAAIGHDLLEDCKVERRRLLEVFGKKGLDLIEGMTNRQGDAHQAAYVRKVAGAPEGVRLIKLADFIDNCDSVTFTLGIMGIDWLDGYFLPIVRPMFKAIIATDFRVFRRTGCRLLELAAASYRQLLDERQRFARLRTKR